MDEQISRPETAPEPTRHVVGTDVVEVSEEAIVVFAKHEMPDWKLREFCVVPIHFRGHKFYLKRKDPGPASYAFRYELAVWHNGLGTESTLAIHYDEDYVAERDQNVRTDRKHRHLHPALFAVYPFLGFFWSGFKERVLSPIGFEPLEITGASIMLAFAVFLLDAVFVFYFHSGFFGMLFGRRLLFALDDLAFLVVPIDCVVRYGRVIQGEHADIGFLEWLFRRNGRRAGRD